MALVRRGGEADKIGNQYEKLWRVKLLVELIAGDAESLTIEAFDSDFSAGVDAAIMRQSDGRLVTELHSVKRQTSTGTWTASLLTQKREGQKSALQSLGEKILAHSPHALGFFISMSPVRSLPDLCETVRRSRDLPTFQERLNHGSEHDQLELKPLFLGLQQKLEIDERECFAVLESLDFKIISEAELDREVRRSIRREVCLIGEGDVDEQTVLSHLEDFMLANLGPHIERHHILTHLAAVHPGYCQKNLSLVPSALSQVQKQNERFMREAESTLIQQSRIERAETDEVMSHVAQEGRSWVMLTGDAGSGKSCVLAQVVRRLVTLQTPTLAFRFDTAAPADSISKLKEFLHINWEPVGLLHSVAGRKKSVLIIDQVDALSDVAGRRNNQQWSVLYELIREAKECHSMSIVLACRAFDLRNDAEIRSLLNKSREDEAKSVQLKVGSLPVELVNAILDKEKVDVGSWKDEHFRVLAVPLHLKLFLRCKATHSGPVESLTALYQCYFSQLESEASKVIPPWNFWQELGRVTECFSQHQAVAVEWAKMQSRGLVTAAEGLISAGVLCDQGEGPLRLVRFFHDTLFDYAFAHAFVGKGESLADFLARNEDRQELFRQTQCRQVLTFLRDGTPAERKRYLHELRALLLSPHIRVHLKFFLLGWLNALPEPWADEWKAVQDAAITPPLRALTKHQRKLWNFQVLRLATWSSPAWFDFLNERDEWRRWLEICDPLWSHQLTWMLGSQGLMKVRDHAMVDLLYRLSEAATPVSQRRVVEVLSWGGFLRSEKAAILFARAFCEGWPGLSAAGVWQHQLHALPTVSKNASLKVLEEILMKRLRLKHYGKMVYSARPLTLQQRIQEGWEDKKMDRRLSLRTSPYRQKWRTFKAWLASILPKKRTPITHKKKRVVVEVLSSWQKWLHKILPPIDDHFLRQHDLSAFISACADYFPREFCDLVITFATFLKAKEGMQADRALAENWTSSHLKDDVNGSLRAAFRRSLQKLADSVPTVAEALLIRLLSINLADTHDLVMKTWTANPQFFACRVLPYFQEDLIRLCSGARELLAATSPWMTNEDLAKIELLILTTPDLGIDRSSINSRFERYYGHPPDKNSSEDRARKLNMFRSRNSVRYALLRSLPAGRLSSLGRRKCTVWTTQYGETQEPVLIENESGFIGSPINETTLPQMSDEQLLGAMRAYPKSRTPERPLAWSRDGFVGQVRMMASRNKPRFLALLPRVDNSVEEDYRTAIIRGLLGEPEGAATGLPLEELSNEDLSRLVTPLAGTSDTTLASAVCGGLERASKRNKDAMPCAWIEILLGFALHHSDPATPEDDQSVTTFGQNFQELHDPLTNGINHVRGAACYALGHVLFDDPKAAVLLRPVMPRLIADKSMGVRACLIEPLTAWLNIDREEAVSWFLQMVKGFDSLLGTPVTEHFLYYACQTHLEQLGPIVDRMIGLPLGKAREIGVRETVLSAFSDSSWRSKADKLMNNPDAEVRAQVATSAAHHWPAEDCRLLSECWLRKAFQDEDTTVQEAAAGVFRQIKNDKWNEVAALAADFIASPALLSAADDFFWPLDEACPTPVDLVIQSIRKVVTIWKRHHGNPEKLQKLTWVRSKLWTHLRMAYHNACTPAQRVECLDILDDLLLEGLSGAGDLEKDDH